MKIFLSLFASFILHILAVGEFLEMTGAFGPLHGLPTEFSRQINITLSQMPYSREGYSETGLKKTDLHEKIVATPKEKKSEHAPVERYTPYLNVYHLRQELTRQPQLVANVDLSPVAALAPGSTSRVVVEIYLNDQGGIDRLDIDANNLPTEAYEKLSELLRQLSFSNGEIDGRAVKTKIKIEVLFLPE